MNSKTPFYVGWQDKMSNEQKKFFRKILIPMFVFIPLLMFALSYFVLPSNNYQFEFGNVKEYSGTYYEKPLPMLVVESNEWPDAISKSAVLVGYGKLGAQGIITEIEKEKGKLNGKKITIKGSLIYGDGKSLIELTDEENSLVSIQAEAYGRPITPLKHKSDKLFGEIIDPKCYFGVMKPAIGKIHKSCAIRCISGGIPPVFKSNQGKYYLMLGEQGQSINKNVLDLVAEPVSVEGQLGQFLDWDIIYIKTGDIKLN